MATQPNIPDVKQNPLPPSLQAPHGSKPLALKESPPAGEKITTEQAWAAWKEEAHIGVELGATHDEPSKIPVARVSSDSRSSVTARMIPVEPTTERLPPAISFLPGSEGNDAWKKARDAHRQAHPKPELAFNRPSTFGERL